MVRLAAGSTGSRMTQSGHCQRLSLTRWRVLVPSVVDRIQPGEGLFRQRKFGRRQILTQVRDRRGAGDNKNVSRATKQPGECDLHGSGTEELRRDLAAAKRRHFFALILHQSSQRLTTLSALPTCQPEISGTLLRHLHHRRTSWLGRPPPSAKSASAWKSLLTSRARSDSGSWPS